MQSPPGCLQAMPGRKLHCLANPKETTQPEALLAAEAAGQARVQQVLRQLAQLEEGRLVVPARLTHRDIAGMAGASREMVTRAFRHLEASGFVRVDGRRITIAEPSPPAR